MKLVKEYLCDDQKPTYDEIVKCMDIATEEDCIVKLTWCVPFGGWYELRVTKDMTFEECRQKLPKIYPV